MLKLQSLNYWLFWDQHQVKHLNGEIQLIQPSSKIWSPILKNGVQTEEKKSLLDRHKIPENIQSLAPPKINEELEVMLLADGKKKDDIVSSYQQQLGQGLSAIGKVISEILSSTESSNPVVNKACAGLGDATKILLDLHYNMSCKRRSTILPSLGTFKKMAEKGTIDSTLFGEDFPARLKTAAELEKTSNELLKKSKGLKNQNSFPSKSNTRVSNSLNSHRPSSYRKFQSVQGGQNQQRGQQRKKYNNKQQKGSQVKMTQHRH